MQSTENQIVVYQPNEVVRLDVRLENETVWLTQAQLCELFGVVKSNSSYHLKGIFAAKTGCGICHDRFIIADQREVFWTGASLKDAGRQTFAAARMGAEVIPGLLESIRKATADRRE